MRQRDRRGEPLGRHVVRRELVERDDDVGAEALLRRDRRLGRQVDDAAVEVAPKSRPALRHGEQLARAGAFGGLLRRRRRRPLGRVGVVGVVVSDIIIITTLRALLLAPDALHLELGAVLVRVRVGEREHLEAARVGDDGRVAPRKGVQAARGLDDVGAGVHEEVIRVAEHELDVGVGGLLGRDALERAVRRYGDEAGRHDRAVRRVDLAHARP
mmetsp:Transcript_26574/g.106406  ORF Transcript_26574/g.106406 Transcript_26574/m.106406 type:complete len:214 (-) Transcript_26574:560-1201(-)